MTNKLVAIALIVVSAVSIQVMVWNGYGNHLAGHVLTFACGVLAGYLAKAK